MLSKTPVWVPQALYMGTFKLVFSLTFNVYEAYRRYFVVLV